MIKAIHSLTRREFILALNGVSRHSYPIEDLKHLKGREVQLQKIEQAVLTKGRHVFVFGERGVGKTSLAKTAGKTGAHSPREFRQIGCAAGTSFEEILRQIIEAYGSDKLTQVERTKGWSFSLKDFGFKNQQLVRQDAPKLSASTAADILASLDEDDPFADGRIFVIDEMDKLEDKSVKEAFADLIKLIGDRACRTTIIFTGVGRDFREILGHHPSSYRHLLQIPLERLDYNPALDIIDDVLQRFELGWEEEPTRTARFRVADIANGFPYYVHLVVEKLMHALYADKEAEDITAKHLSTAIENAVLDVEEVIRAPYEAAVSGRSRDIKLAVWAAADSWDLERGASQIYASYVGICERVGHPSLESKKFSALLGRLKGPSYGAILKGGMRRGLYEFTENITRGYVRLCAAADGVELVDARYKNPRPVVTAQARAARRYIDPRSLGGPPSTLRR
ncbi:hypothetical protein B1992_02495 [Pseudoxanthomonas broegbernensis]|uniref:AAA+ ATPase domain-containing protein n=1 Tax=Pseudoxanthomonas broegbernensis TaxID=83619 RepID=A0A7V8GPE3_9GAMM|nr:ATP-binding protein [Pseudoxanthomonas broegbernensis]KAF1687554.1 hypothetical protein B1992_02495 [Pseudoxanthomonas broegbernensis]MBB6064564.1 Cdc6-like AAA superfamily ATPase [Pseudoxanthomonas broegbernensis]